jgi:hypothetical protein
LLGDNIEKHAFEYGLALEGIHNSPIHDIDTGHYNDTFRPFATKEQDPNAFSIFHLVYQSIKQDFVTPFPHSIHY